jgi:hypothetical protein
MVRGGPFQMPEVIGDCFRFHDIPVIGAAQESLSQMSLHYAADKRNIAK